VILEPLTQYELLVKKWAQSATSSLRCASTRASSLQVPRETTHTLTHTVVSFAGSQYDTQPVFGVSEVSFPPGESKSTKLQERLLREAAAFIITHQIPAFVRVYIQSYKMHMEKQHATNSTCVCVCVCVQVEFCLQSNEAPMDGESLKQALHQRGINLRYLGHVITTISQSEQKEQLRHILVSLIFKMVKLDEIISLITTLLSNTLLFFSTRDWSSGKYSPVQQEGCSTTSSRYFTPCCPAHSFSVLCLHTSK